MKPIFKLAILAAAFLAPMSLGIFMFGQEAERVPLIEDWTTQHVVFSNPEAVRSEGGLQGWPLLTPEEREKIKSDVRYRMQELRRNHQQEPTGIFEIEEAERGELSRRLRRKLKSRPQGDWSYFLGGTANAGVNDGLYPAKYSYNINATPSCANDYVTFLLNQKGAAATAATGSLVFGQASNSPPANNSQVQVGAVVYSFQTTLTTATTIDTCNVKIPAGDNGKGSAANLTAAINNSGGTNYSCDPASANANVTAANPTAPNDIVNLTAKLGGEAGNSLPLAVSSTPSTNANVTVFANGKEGQPSIVAFNNLYVAPGTQGSAIGTFSSNGIDNGQTITISNGSASLVLTATSTTATGSITVDSVTGLNGKQVSIGTGVQKVQYNFSAVPVLTPPAGQCNVYEGLVASTATAAANLGSAIDSGAGSTTTFLCAAGANPNAAVGATGTGNQVNLTSRVPGSEGDTIFTALSSNATAAEITLSGATLTGGTDGSNLGTNFQYTSSTGVDTTTQLAANLTSIINNNGSGVGFTAVQGTGANSDLVTVFGPPNGTGNTIALSTDATGFSWSSFTGNTAPSGLCAGSPATVGAPTVMWAYNVTTSPVTTWPTLSYDGTKVAFLEQNNGGGFMHLLKWKAGEGTVSAPATPTNTTLTNWASCPANTSCMINLTDPHGNEVTNSSIFPNFGPDGTTDTAFLGDNGGYLYKVTGIFNGTPGAGWTYLISAGKVLTGPVFDSRTNSVIVADNLGNVYCVTDNGTTAASCGTVAAQAGTTSGFKSAIADPPIVDIVTGDAFVFGNDWNTQPANTSSAAVVEIPLASFNVASVKVANLGPAGEETLHDGIFDNIFYSSANGTGNLYACSSTSVAGNPSTIWSIPIAAGVMSTTATAGPAVTTDKEECSPLNEIYNTAQGIDWLFVGAPKNCASGGSATGCVMSFSITAGPPAVFDSTAAEEGGTSGIVVDNISTSGEASSLYFSTLGGAAGACGTNPVNDDSSCAVKRTQSGLH
ncbi:MAG TPA: hypothetical protein VGM18_00220 [Candidatus Sulfotelmatobacter sp.]